MYVYLPSIQLHIIYLLYLSTQRLRQRSYSYTRSYHLSTYLSICHLFENELDKHLKTNIYLFVYLFKALDTRIYMYIYELLSSIYIFTDSSLYIYSQNLSLDRKLFTCKVLEIRITNCLQLKSYFLTCMLIFKNSSMNRYTKIP